MSFILSSAALSRLVLVRDCEDDPLDTLAESAQARSEEEISLGLRFFYCTGLAIALLAMGAVSLSHEHKIPLTCRMPKWARLLNRLGVCIIFFCLPAAQDLNSLHLITITTSLTVWVLLFEIWGKSCKNESFFASENDKCRYTARCNRRQLEDAMRNEGELDPIEFSKGRNGAVPDMLQ